MNALRGEAPSERKFSLSLMRPVLTEILADKFGKDRISSDVEDVNLLTQMSVSLMAQAQMGRKREYSG